MRFGGIVLAVLLALSACSSGPEPREPEQTVTATPKVTEPAMPEQARQDTPEGASAFVAHYIGILNYASSTGDTEELSHLSDPECSGCQKYIDLYHDTYEEGGSFIGGEWSPGEMRLELGDAETYVTTTVVVSSSEFLGPDGETAVEQESTSKVSFAVAGDPWVVTQLGLGAPQ